MTVPRHIHDLIEEAARANAERAPDYFTTEQRDVLARTFIPALRKLRAGNNSRTA